MINKIYKNQLLFALMVLLYILPVNAQYTNTLYFMDWLPQHNQLNPSFQPKKNFYVGMPIVNGLEFNTGNNYWSLYDIATPKNGALIFFYDKAKAISSLNKENSLFFNMQSNLSSWGFRAKSLYLTFNISTKMFSSFVVPGDLYKFALNGFDTATNYNFNGLGFNAQAYTEAAFGLSKVWNDEFTFGVKGKILIGHANLSSDYRKMGFSSGIDKTTQNMFLNINSDVTFNMFAPGAEVTPDANGKVSLDSIKINSPSVSNFLGNYGLGLDLGVTYRPIEELKLSLSVLDIGMIRWSGNVYNFTLKGNYNYIGPEIEFVGENSKINPGEALINTLDTSFKATSSKLAFNTFLPWRVMFGAEYFLHPRISVGLLSATQYYRGNFMEQIMLSGNFRILKLIQIIPSYSFIGNGFSSMGMGMLYNLGPMQFYLMSDNIPVVWSKYFIPYKFKYINLNLGFNITFGDPIKRKYKDKPLVFD